MDTKNNFYNMQNIVLSNEFKLISMNLLKNLNIVSLKNNILELNFETIKRITVNNNFRQDFELRRKTGNLIAEKILECFFDDLPKIKMTEYNLGLSIDEFPETLKKLNKLNISTNDKNNKLNLIKNKYRVSLELMKNTVEKKLEDINNNSFDITKITKDRNFLYFKNLSNSQDNDNSDVILNLYFIFRKGINEKINFTIHNEIEKINSMIKEEIAKIDIKKKTNNKNKGNQKEEEEKVVIPKGNNDSSLNVINSNNLIENDLCKVKYKELNKINQIKREENIYEENINFLRSFELETNEKIIEMSAEEFNSQLREINKSYEVSDNILIEEAINLFMYGEKGYILVPQKSFNSEASIKEQLNIVFK